MKLLEKFIWLSVFISIVLYGLYKTNLFDTQVPPAQSTIYVVDTMRLSLQSGKTNKQIIKAIDSFLEKNDHITILYSDSVFHAPKTSYLTYEQLTGDQIE